MYSTTPGHRVEAFRRIMALDTLRHSKLFQAFQMIMPNRSREKTPGFEAGASPPEISAPVRLPSPQKNLERYPELSKLARDIRANYVKGGMNSNERFLPNDKVEKLVTRENVLLALRETRTKGNHEDLATWVLEGGKRLFLILVVLTNDTGELLSSLRGLKDDGIDDSVLPLAFEETKPCYGYSETLGGQHFHSFKDWEENSLILFRIYQWIFLAPVFGASTRTSHELRSEVPVPLLNLKPTRSNILGDISHGEIHPAHLDSKYRSELAISTSGMQGIPVSIKIDKPSDNLDPFYDIDFKVAHATISPLLYQPIAAYTKGGQEFLIFQWIENNKVSRDLRIREYDE